MLRDKGLGRYVINGNKNGKYHSYYVVESQKALIVLEEYRKEIRIK